MGEFWKSYVMDNGQRMSKRQIKKVRRLEEQIEDCTISIVGLERIISDHSEEIERIKARGRKKQKPELNFEIF